MKKDIELAQSIRRLKDRIEKADRQFSEWAETGEDWLEPDWFIESCYLQLLATVELMGLENLRQMILVEFAAMKEKPKGFLDARMDPNEQQYSSALVRALCYLSALEGFFAGDESTTVTKDLLQIIRDIHYVITDTGVYSKVPANEVDVHVRIEAILKCVFPDLKHKPMLTKQIKNFEPDTGIPSIKTLIEYKFLSQKEAIGRIADELLADTRGYNSPEWTRFLYVIYETERFKTESDWNQLLRQSGVPPNASIVVLGGVIPKPGNGKLDARF